MKTFNQYAELVADIYAATPKAVFAAIAVSFANISAEDNLSKARDGVVEEWWLLYLNGIVPQKPPVPQPSTLPTTKGEPHA